MLILQALLNENNSQVYYIMELCKLNKSLKPMFHNETRRTIARLNLMYKICHGNVDIDKNSYLCSSKICGTRTRSSHDYKFFNINATKDVYFYSFFPRTLRVWNKLPKDVVDSNSLEIFKTKISKYFIEQF